MFFCKLLQEKTSINNKPGSFIQLLSSSKNFFFNVKYYFKKFYKPFIYHNKIWSNILIDGEEKQKVIKVIKND